MDLKDIKDLILTIDKTSIESVEIEKSGLVIKVNKRLKNERIINDKLTDITTIDNLKIDSNEPKLEASKEENIEQLEEDTDVYIVSSPMVGTFYSAPSPESNPFVKVGDNIEKGQTLCIVEAMKMMNEIKSDSQGVVLEILVEDEDIIEYGQPLMKIRR